MDGRSIPSSADVTVVDILARLGRRLSRFERSVRTPLSARRRRDLECTAGVFVDAFFFSVETLSTIGYGQMSPATLYGNIVMTVEAMFGLGLIAVAAGLMFARFSRPTARVMFSKVAVVTEHNGVPTLSLRLANERRKSDPRGPGLPRTGSRRAHYRGRMDPPILRSATGAPTEFDLRNDLHRHASDRHNEPVME
jgi:hypothetical protein